MRAPTKAASEPVATLRSRCPNRVETTSGSRMCWIRTPRPDTTAGSAWTNPLAGLIVAAVTVQEGREARHGENCGCASTLAVTGSDDERDDDTADTADCTDGCCTPTRHPSRPQTLTIHERRTP